MVTKIVTKQQMFDMNMKAFEKRYPQYAKMVKFAKTDESYEIRKAAKFPTLYHKKNDVYIYDKTDPIVGVARNLASFEFTNVRMGVFMGFGLGYDPVYYTEQASLKYHTELILIIEHDPGIIKLAFRHCNYVPLIEHQNIYMLVGHYGEDLFKVITKWLGEPGAQRFYLLGAAKFIYNAEYYELHREYYTQAVAAFKKAAKYIIMYYGNDPKDSFVGVENMFANVKEIVENPGVNLLKDKFKGIPAVCVATGPSLDKNVELLRGLEDKAIIIAADASLKPLLDKGLKPHMITTLEREIDIVKLFKDIPAEQYDDVYMCGCPVIYNEVYQTYKGPKIIVYRSFDHFKWLGIDRGMLEIKFSSGNMNFKIAEYLGCDPIILIGQDLCIYGDKTNADGAVLGVEQQTYLREARSIVKGNYEDKVTTTHSLKLMLESYVMDVHGYEGRCINATEGGAYIDKTEIMTFAEAIEKHVTEKYDIKRILTGELAKFKADTGDYKKVLANIEKSIGEFAESVKVCDEAYEYFKGEIPKLTENIIKPDKAYIDGVFKKMVASKSNMQKDLFTWQLFFAHIAQSVFVNFEIQMNAMGTDYKDIEAAKAKILSENLKYFEVIGGLIKVSIKTLEEQKRRMEGFYESVTRHGALRQDVALPDMAW